MRPARNTTHNAILDAATTAEFGRLQPFLRSVVMPLGTTMHQAGQGVRSVLFPTSGVISMVARMQDGAAVEVGIIGNETMLGFDLAMGGTTIANTAVAQQAGACLRLPAAKFLEAMEEPGKFRAAVLRSVLVYLRQVSQTAACNARHRLNARFARWLLLMGEQVEGDSFPLTQEFAATMLGARRAGVSAAAAGLQRQGLIQYRRGRVEILDRDGLMEAACECYAAVAAATEGRR